MNQPITLNLSDHLPCSGNHPGYSQEKGCAPDEYFQCDRCLRIVPWCIGAADDMPESCDGCWYAMHKEEYVTSDPLRSMNIQDEVFLDE